MLWPMRKVIAAAQRETGTARSLLLELYSMADAGASLADSVIDEVAN